MTFRRSYRIASLSSVASWNSFANNGYLHRGSRQRLRSIRSSKSDSAPWVICSRSAVHSGHRGARHRLQGGSAESHSTDSSNPTRTIVGAWDSVPCWFSGYSVDGELYSCFSLSPYSSLIAS